MDLKINGQELATTEQGFLVNYQDWTRQVAEQMAQQERLILMTEHWEILVFIQDYYQRYQHLPNSRLFVKAIAKKLGVEKGNSHYLQGLFPKGPLKIACKLAGLPKPPTCL